MSCHRRGLIVRRDLLSDPPPPQWLAGRYGDGAVGLVGGGLLVYLAAAVLFVGVGGGARVEAGVEDPAKLNAPVIVPAAGEGGENARAKKD